jgi:hypothetical protein
MNVKNELADGREANDQNETNDQNRPVVLCEFENEFQATALLAELQASGIEASTTGGFTAGFRAESPGLVQVVVRQVDAELAKEVFANLGQSKSEIDWSKVDVGEPED